MNHNCFKSSCSYRQSVQTPKPPLGLQPKKIWEELRRDEVKDAIQRYLEAGLPVPEEWLSEYNNYIA